MEEVKQHYLSALNELKDTSKPVINFLTMLAQDYQNHADVVVSVIAERLRLNPGNNIRFLYLVDSIVKNVGGKYTLSFEERLPQLVKHVMGQGNPDVRKRVVRTRVTWDGVFSAAVLRRIDDYIASLKPPGSAPPTTRTPQPSSTSAPAGRPLAADTRASGDPRRSRHGPPPPSSSSPSSAAAAAGAVGARDPRLAAHRRQPPPQHQHPHGYERDRDHARRGGPPSAYEHAAPTPLQGPQGASRRGAPESSPPMTHGEIMEALRKGDEALMSGSLPPDRRLQLEGVVSDLRKELADRGFPVPPPPWHAGQPPHRPRGPPVQRPTRGRAPPPRPQHTHRVPPLDSSTAHPGTPPRHARQHKEASPPTPTTLMQQVHASGMLESLLKEVSSPETAVKASRGRPSPRPQKKEPSTSSAGASMPDLSNIAVVELTDLSIKETKEDGYITLMYEAQPTQCKQCGLRFPDNASEDFKLHYDWHFRRNQERQQSAVVSRGWYLSEEDWVKYAGSKIEDMPTESTEKQKKKEEERARTILKTQRVKAKDDQRCKICQERFATFYDDDEEEWLLKDAMETSEGLFHISCYEVASKSELQSSVSRVSSSNVLSPTTPTSAVKAEEAKDEEAEETEEGKDQVGAVHEAVKHAGDDVHVKREHSGSGESGSPPAKKANVA